MYFDIIHSGFPGGSVVKNLPAVQETGFDSWVRKIPWRRKWQPTPGFLPGESHGQRSLVGYSPWGCKESDTTEWISNKSKYHLPPPSLPCFSYPIPTFLLPLIQISPFSVAPLVMLQNINCVSNLHFLFYNLKKAHVFPTNLVMWEHCHFCPHCFTFCLLFISIHVSALLLGFSILKGIILSYLFSFIWLCWILAFFLMDKL